MTHNTSSLTRDSVTVTTAAKSMNPALPFGGCGFSGYGRKHGLEGSRVFAYAHAFSVKTSPARMSPSTFDTHPGALQEALAAVQALAWNNTETK